MSPAFAAPLVEASPRPGPAPRVSAEDALAAVRSGATLAQAGLRLGVSREWVRQLLLRSGVTTAQAAGRRCFHCGRWCTGGRRSARGLPPACGRRECRNARDREASRAERAVRREARLAAATACAGCGRRLSVPPRADGRPSFCNAPACKSARLKWLYGHDPAYNLLQRRRPHEPGLRLAEARRRLALPPEGDAGGWRVLPPALVAAVLARKGTASQRVVARERGVSRGAVWAIWRRHG